MAKSPLVEILQLIEKLVTLPPPPHRYNNANTATAAKYKEYENLRALLGGKALPHTSKDQKRKRSAKEDAPKTPSKRAAKTISTPGQQKPQITLDNNPIENTPPAPRPVMLGPTPQKNGIFIGIFDHLPAETPSHERTALSEVNINAPATPSKIAATPEFERSKYTRTPMSEGRRFLLDQFVTPRKRKQQEEEQERTPSSIAKRFMTPAFFRQYTQPLDTISEETPKPRPLPGRRPFLKTLSSMIKEIRDAEEEKADADLDVLRDLENDEKSGDPEAKEISNASFKEVETKPADLDRDGFKESDVEAEINEINEAEQAEAEKSGIFKKIWKKKGLKRQTKRINSAFTLSPVYPFANM
jgi:hypothetical protein